MMRHGGMIAWLYGSRYGTSGKVQKLQIPSPKECGTTALLKTQYPMNPPPHSPISPSPLLNNSYDNHETMQKKSHVNCQLSSINETRRYLEPESFLE
jgi:hypothetical protein